MINYKNLKKTIIVGVAAIFVASCSNDKTDDFSETESNSKFEKTDLKAIMNTDQVSGSIDGVINQISLLNVTGKEDTCYEYVRTDKGLTVTFDNCTIGEFKSTDGTVKIEYTGTKSYTAIFADFVVDGITLNGVREFNLVDPEDGNTYAASVTSDMEITLADGTVMIEKGTKTTNFSLSFSKDNSAYTLTGSWALTIGDNSYKVVILNGLTGIANCDYVTGGIMNVEKNGIVVKVDFGDGTCDDKANVTYPDGTVEEISLED